jgi:hypothetical protein
MRTLVSGAYTEIIGLRNLICTNNEIIWAVGIASLELQYRTIL